MREFFFILLLAVITSAERKQTKREMEDEIRKLQRKLKMNDTAPEEPPKPKHPKIEQFSKEASVRPTKCQVCRVFAQELAIEVEKGSGKEQDLWLTSRLDSKDTDAAKKGKKISYKKSEIRLMDILEKVCKNVFNYRSIAGPDFPYLKGVKSMFRQQLEDMMGEHKVGVKLDAPEDLIEDPTFELRRMQFKCNEIIEENEDDIFEWYLHKQEEDPLEYLCAERILQEKEQDCLFASTVVPDFAKEPKKKEEGMPNQEFHTGHKMEL